MKVRTETESGRANGNNDDSSPRFPTSGTILSTSHHTSLHFSCSLSLSLSLSLSFTPFLHLNQSVNYFFNQVVCFHLNKKQQNARMPNISVISFVTFMGNVSFKCGHLCLTRFTSISTCDSGDRLNLVYPI